MRRLIDAASIAIAKVECRIIQAARDVRRLEKERPGKAEACACVDAFRPACSDRVFFELPLWCPGCRARHHTTQALYAARRRLRTATDRLEALECKP